MDLEGCVTRALSQLTADVRTRFAADPLGVLRSELGLTVTAVEHLAKTRDGGGACDGVSFLKDGVILYAATPMSRRENFTLAHELGHWLAEKAPGVYDWIADQDDPLRLLETVCDRIAQRLLLPETAARGVIGEGPIRAHHLIDLYQATHASRPVCAIALAKHLPGMGAIAIIDRSKGTIDHASIQPDPEQGWPTVFPWPGQQLADGHPLLHVRDGSFVTRRLSWRTSWGTQADFYIDAIGDGKRVIVVFSDVDHWGVDPFHPAIEREFDARPVLSGHCCGTSFEQRGYPCPSCGKPFCPQCGDCRCDRDAKQQVRCNGCFLMFRAGLVTNGLCVECRS